MSKPFLSVILPTYNRKYCVGRMINSVLKQNFTDFELIIVDDGSSDNTAEMIEEKYNDCRIKLIKKENGGVSSARNAGISVAVGEWITFVDSDDYLLDGFFEDIYQTLQKVDCEVLVYGGYSVDSENQLKSIPLFWIKSKEEKEMTKSGKDFFRDFCLLHGNSWACAKVFKRSLIVSHSLSFDENIHYGEDMLFNLMSYWIATSVTINPKKYYVGDTNNISLTERHNQNQKVKNLIATYDFFGQDFVCFRHLLALNLIRHLRSFLLCSYFELNKEEKQKIRRVCLEISDGDCRTGERIGKRIAKRSLLFFALYSFIYPHACILYSKVISIFNFRRR